MENIYSFVDEIQADPSKMPNLEDVTTKILRQTFECCIYIREYSVWVPSGMVMHLVLPTYVLNFVS
jgi:hypothetical protein